MTWTKTSDDFPDDCWTLSDRAYRLHHEGLTWSNRKLLDCRLPKDDVRRFARNGEDGVTELLNCGWWSDGGDCYVINHHASYQRTREEVLRQQDANARNGRKGGRPRKAPREIVGNPVGLRTALPDENPGGQDGTGQAVTGSTTPVLTSEEEETLAEYEAEQGYRPDDPDMLANHLDEAS